MSNNWHPHIELCGFILNDGSTVEVENLATDSKRDFSFNVENLPNNVIGFWHSHPNNDENLSTEDYIKFLQFPDFIHRIYTKDSFSEYYVRENLVFKRE